MNKPTKKIKVNAAEYKRAGEMLKSAVIRMNQARELYDKAALEVAVAARVIRNAEGLL